MKTTTLETISGAQFARRDGCSYTVVNRAIATGRLKRCPDGKLLASLVGTPWRKGNVGKTKPAEGLWTTEAPKGDGFETKSDAERVKETYLALMRKVEYDKEAGIVIKIADVCRIVASEYSRVRSKLMAMAATIAPQAAMLSSPSEIQRLINREIGEVLKELTYDEVSARQQSSRVPATKA